MHPRTGAAVAADSVAATDTQGLRKVRRASIFICELEPTPTRRFWFFGKVADRRFIASGRRFRGHNERLVVKATLL
jgi:hypothetical protein